MFLSSSLRIFGWLLWRDIRNIKHDIWNNILDALIVPSTIIIVNGYVLPYLGLPVSYGSFMVASSVIMMLYMATSWQGGNQLAMDLDGERTISYDLTLPLPSWMVFCKIAIVNACNAAVRNALTLSMGKLLLWNRFDLSHMNVYKVVLFYILVSLFLGFFALVPVCFVKGMAGFVRYQWRIGSQLIFYSGFQFPWLTMLQAVPVLAYVSLLNPLVYCFEGMHAAVLGQEGYLNFWLCSGVLLLSMICFGFIITKKLKAKLDCI